MKEYMRLESDSIGTMEVPEDAYYGVQALRAKENFPITGTRLHPVFIKNLAKIKRAAAITNRPHQYGTVHKRCHSNRRKINGSRSSQTFRQKPFPFNRCII